MLASRTAALVTARGTSRRPAGQRRTIVDWMTNYPDKVRREGAAGYDGIPGGEEAVDWGGICGYCGMCIHSRTTDGNLFFTVRLQRADVKYILLEY